MFSKGIQLPERLKMNRKDGVVTASEIGSWSFCPESWRLAMLGKEPEDRGDILWGAAYHEGTAAFERRSRRAIDLGRRLLAAAAFLILLAAILASLA